MKHTRNETSFKQSVKHYIDQIEYFRNISEECPYFPQEICIEPTNACNLRCIHCHHHISPQGKRAITRPFGMMDLGLYQEIIAEIAPLQCRLSLDLQGEPTLHPRLPEMVAYAKSQGVFTSVLTNATRLTDRLTEQFIEMQLDRIVFSFDAVEKRLYESIRVKARFEPTLRNLLNFIKRNHEKGHHTHVCMAIIRQQKTIDHIDTYTRYFHNLPIDRIFISDLLNLSGGSGVSDEISLDAFQHDPEQSRPICRVPWENIVVNWDGKVTICPLDYNVYYPVGDRTQTSLQALWNNARFRQFRSAHLTGDYRLIEENGPLCGSCNCLWDPEYDLRRFRDFAVEAICRDAVHFARQLAASPPEDEDQRYHHLLQELARVEEMLAKDSLCG